MKYTIFRQKMRSPLFTLQELRLRQMTVFPYQLSLWQKQGYLTKVKNGLYLFSDQLDKITAEELTAYLYPPSYISLERALFHYGFIPEVVPVVTSITSRATRRFHNALGYFTFRHVQPALFFGYQAKKGKDNHYALAEPEKAVLDFLYLNLHRIKAEEDLAEFRLNKEIILEKLSQKKWGAYLNRFRNQPLNEISQWLWRKA